MKFTRFSFAPFAASLLAIALLTGCSTVASRIKEERPTFDKLSPDDQELVAHGRIREGLGKRAVYIAWGRPDRVLSGAMKKKAYDSWLYFGYWTDTYYNYNWIPYSRGNRVYFAPVTQPNYVTYPYLFKQVTFENGRVVAFEAPVYR